MSVVLINPFEVPAGREDECLALWEQAAAHLRAQPGFISTTLHRALAPDARFAFVNVAEWESAEHFQRAIGSAEFRRIAIDAMSEFPHFPALYDVVRR